MLEWNSLCDSCVESSSARGIRGVVLPENIWLQEGKYLEGGWIPGAVSAVAGVRGERRPCSIWGVGVTHATWGRGRDTEDTEGRTSPLVAPPATSGNVTTLHSMLHDNISDVRQMMTYRGVTAARVGAVVPLSSH